MSISEYHTWRFMMPFIFHCDSIFIHMVKVLLISPLYNCCFFFLTINNQSVGHNLRPCEYLAPCQNSLLDLAYIDNFCLTQSFYNGYNADFPASAPTILPLSWSSQCKLHAPFFCLDCTVSLHGRPQLISSNPCHMLSS